MAAGPLKTSCLKRSTALLCAHFSIYINVRRREAVQNVSITNYSHSEAQIIDFKVFTGKIIASANGCHVVIIALLLHRSLVPLSLC